MFQPPPERFEGRLSAFVDDVVLPNLPSPDALCAWTDALLSYLSRPDAVCLVRGSRPSTDRVVYGDNAAARWIFLRARDGGTSPDTLADRLERGDLPVRFATHTGPLAYGHTFDPADQRDTAEPGLKHCHLASALEGAPDDPRVRAARNLVTRNLQNAVVIFFEQHPLELARALRIAAFAEQSWRGSLPHVNRRHGRR